MQPCARSYLRPRAPRIAVDPRSGSATVSAHMSPGALRGSFPSVRAAISVVCGVQSVPGAAQSAGDEDMVAGRKQRVRTPVPGAELHATSDRLSQRTEALGARTEALRSSSERLRAATKRLRERTERLQQEVAEPSRLTSSPPGTSPSSAPSSPPPASPAGGSGTAGASGTPAPPGSSRPTRAPRPAADPPRDRSGDDDDQVPTVRTTRSGVVPRESRS